jgi:very-short-patch-repair endonuclease
VISVGQLREAGLSEDAIRGRVGAGRLHRVYRGVYAVGHFGLSVEGQWMAAVLACGDGAALSHRAAAGLWRLLDWSGGAIDVSVPTTSGRARRAGVRLHRRVALGRRLQGVRNGIPVTTPAQTLADLRGQVSPSQVRRAIRQAEVRGLRTGLERTREPTRSELEDLFLRLCRRRRLPMPAVNVRVGSHEVDFFWRRQRLVVETDGYRYHRGSQAFEDDHARDLALRIQGFDVLRLSYRQVTEDPAKAAAAIAQALRR